MLRKIYTIFNFNHTKEPDEPTTSHNDVFKHSSQFETIQGKPEHGHHQLEIVRDKETGKEYVKKDVPYRADFVKEVMYGNFLQAAFPTKQPKYLVMESSDVNGNTKYHVLSEKFPNSEDLENAVRNGKTNELLNEDVDGWERFNIIPAIIGSNDHKLDNGVIATIKKDVVIDGVVVGSKEKKVISNIDFERAASPTFSIFNSRQSKYPSRENTATLANSIYDKYPKDDENHAGLAGDRRAVELVDEVNRKMKPKNVDKTYHSLAQVNIHPVINQCEALTRVCGIFKPNDCRNYEKKFNNIIENSAEQVRKYE